MAGGFADRSMSDEDVVSGKVSAIIASEISGLVMTCLSAFAMQRTASPFAHGNVVQ